MEKVKNFCVENSASILTGLGVVGVASTAVLAATATPKALRLLEEKEKFKQEEYGYSLTRFEKVLAVAPAYIPAVLAGLATTSCILGANRINRYKQASLISAYTYLDSTFKEYQRKVKEVFGEDVAIFPLLFKALKFIPTTGTENGERYITLPGIIEVFADEVSNVEDVHNVRNSGVTKYVKDGALYILVGENTYDILGSQVAK